MENKGGENTPYEVVVLPYPSQGHISPMLQFSKLLASQGLKVTLLTSTFIAKTLPAAVGQVRVGQISDGFDDGGFADAGTVEAYLESLKAVGSRDLSDLLERQRQSTCCLVYDAFLPWALEVAKRLGIVGAAFFTQACAVNSFYYHKYHGKLASLVAGETISLPGLPPLEIPDLPSFLSVAGSYPGYLSLVVNQFSSLQMADWVLVNTFDKLEAEVVRWMEGLWPMKTIGPTVPSTYLGNPLKGDNDYGLAVYKPAGGACIRWLDACPTGSVAYVSFGSMATLEPEQMEELARGLQEANTHFLWVVRELEKEKLPKGFADETKAKGLIIPWSPQLEILAHPAVGCFVTHCGWNSVLEGLCLGVPMVGVPQWTDQPTNAKFVEDIWRVGLRAKVDEKGIVRREEVKRCVLEVVEGEGGKEMKRNGSKWKELAKEAVDEGGSTDKNIKDFVRSICNK